MPCLPFLSFPALCLSVCVCVCVCPFSSSCVRMKKWKSSSYVFSYVCFMVYNIDFNHLEWIADCWILIKHLEIWEASLKLASNHWIIIFVIKGINIILISNNLLGMLSSVKFLCPVYEIMIKLSIVIQEFICDLVSLFFEKIHKLIKLTCNFNC